MNAGMIRREILPLRQAQGQDDGKGSQDDGKKRIQDRGLLQEKYRRY